ncbi:MAG: Hsp33 family molecular chaperone HslO [Desulfobacterales bacterium]
MIQEHDITDYLVRIITREGNTRGLACVTTALTAEACNLHGTLPTAGVALGRALTGGALMGALLKTGQRVALKFEGNGPLRKILVEADSNGAVRGYVGEPRTDLPPVNGKFDIPGALGKAGFLTVTKDLGVREPYRSIVQLRTSEIAEDMAWYFAESEQIPSAVGLGTYADPEKGVTVSGGFLIQAMPPQDDDVISRLTNRIQAMPSVTELLRGGSTPENLLDIMFADIPFDVLEKRRLAFQCSCSKERMERALIALGRSEIEKLVSEMGGADLTCEFCRSFYRFSSEELNRLAERSSSD